MNNMLNKLFMNNVKVLQNVPPYIRRTSITWNLN